MQNNTIVVHDSQYEMTAAYVTGAKAFRAGVPERSNPHAFGSRSYDDWDCGHMNEGADEHFRFGRDLLEDPRSGAYFNMDPTVPRVGGADVDENWARQQRQLLVTRAAE